MTDPREMTRAEGDDAPIESEQVRATGPDEIDIDADPWDRPLSLNEGSDGPDVEPVDDELPADDYVEH